VSEGSYRNCPKKFRVSKRNDKAKGQSRNISNLYHNVSFRYIWVKPSILKFFNSAYQDHSDLISQIVVEVFEQMTIEPENPFVKLAKEKATNVLSASPMKSYGSSLAR
jgi:hypothetical protein